MEKKGKVGERLFGYSILDCETLSDRTKPQASCLLEGDLVLCPDGAVEMLYSLGRVWSLTGPNSVCRKQRTADPPTGHTGGD